MKFLSTFVPLALGLGVTMTMASPLASDAGDCVTTTTYIGATKSVKVETTECGTTEASSGLEKRQDVVDLCFVGCMTECNALVPGTPTPVVYDCEGIAAALRYEADLLGNTGPFSVAPGATVTMTSGQCTTTFTNNRTTGSVGFCQEGWAATLFGLTNACGSVGAGGVCRDRAFANRWNVSYARP